MNCWPRTLDRPRWRGLAALSRVCIAIILIVTAEIAVDGRPLAHAAQPSPSSPQAVSLIESFHGVLIDVMKRARSLGVKGRFEVLAPAVKSAFHMPLMAQISAGLYWRQAGDDAKRGMAQAFERLSVAVYASRFDGYSGQSFVTLGAAPGPKGSTLVRTVIRSPGADDVALTYVVKQVQGRTAVVDILLDGGISELAVRKSEYRGVLKSQGVGGLIAVLGKKADLLLAP